MIIFNSSMPRACSTLMQNILGQHPDIHVTPTDGLLSLLGGSRQIYSNSPEFKAQDNEAMRRAWLGYCWGATQGYADALSSKRVVCIKARGMVAHYEWCRMFFETGGQPPPKVICMVRDMRSIFASMEKLHRANPDRANPVQMPGQQGQRRGATVEMRCDEWASQPPIGPTADNLNDAIRMGFKKHIHFVRAEDLCDDPAATMEKVYAYLGISPHLHDFGNVTQITQEDDAFYNLGPTLHKIRSEVKPNKPDYLDVLGRHACQWVAKRYEWYQEEFGYA